MEALLINGLSVSFRVLTPGGGAGSGFRRADEKISPTERPTDSKRRCKNFCDLFLQISPISSQSQLLPPPHNSSLVNIFSSFFPSSRPQTQRKIFPLRPRSNRPNTPPKSATAPHYEVWAKPQKIFSHISPGPNRLPGGQCLNETLNGLLRNVAGFCGGKNHKQSQF
jgi:hypothetical protein